MRQRRVPAHAAAWPRSSSRPRRTARATTSYRTGRRAPGHARRGHPAAEDHIEVDQLAIRPTRPSRRVEADVALDGEHRNPVASRPGSRRRSGPRRPGPRPLVVNHVADRGQHPAVHAEPAATPGLAAAHQWRPLSAATPGRTPGPRTQVVLAGPSAGGGRGGRRRRPPAPTDRAPPGPGRRPDGPRRAGHPARLHPPRRRRPRTHPRRSHHRPLTQPLTWLTVVLGAC